MLFRTQGDRGKSTPNNNTVSSRRLDRNEFGSSRSKFKNVIDFLMFSAGCWRKPVSGLFTPRESTFRLMETESRSTSLYCSAGDVQTVSTSLENTPTDASATPDGSPPRTNGPGPRGPARLPLLARASVVRHRAATTIDHLILAFAQPDCVVRVLASERVPNQDGTIAGLVMAPDLEVL